MSAKQSHRLKLLEYLGNWENKWPKTQVDMAKILGISTRAMRKHFTLAELTEIENEGIEMRKKAAAKPRADLYKALVKAGKKGQTSAIREFLDRTEGKIPERREITGKDGKDLFDKVEIKLVSSSQ